MAGIIDNAQRAFIFVGFIISKLQYVFGVALLSAVTITSLLSYAGGYILWFISCEMYSHKINSNKYSGNMVLFRTWHKIAAILGLSAVLCLLISISTYNLVVVSYWLFAGSDIFWCFGEFNRTESIEVLGGKWSSKERAATLKYTIMVTIFTLFTALMMTTISFYPAIALPLLLVSSLGDMFLGCIIIDSWIKCNLNINAPNIEILENEECKKSLNTINFVPRNSCNIELQNTPNAKRSIHKIDFEKIVIFPMAAPMLPTRLTKESRFFKSTADPKAIENYIDDCEEIDITNRQYIF